MSQQLGDNEGGGNREQPKPSLSSDNLIDLLKLNQPKGESKQPNDLFGFHQESEEELKEFTASRRKSETNKYQMQELATFKSVNNNPTTPIIQGFSDNSPFKRDFSGATSPLVNINLIGGAGARQSELLRSTGSQHFHQQQQPRKSGTPVFERVASSQQLSQIGSQRRDTVSGLLRVGKGNQSQMSQQQSQLLINKIDEVTQKRRPLCKIVMYNCIENIMLFAALLNSIVYPSASSTLYYLCALGLTGMSMTGEEKKIKLKQVISIFFIIIAVGLLVGKGTFLIMINNEGDLNLTSDQRLLYDSLGIKIDQTQTRIKIYTTFMTLFFDCIQLLLSIVLTLIYQSQKTDSKRPFTDQTKYLLHFYFLAKHESLCLFALFILGLSTIFIQTIIQAFIMLVLLVLFAAWAYDSLDKNQLRSLILKFALCLLILQLTVTFVFQIPAVKQELIGNQSTFIWDMFGFQLHNMNTYQVVLHLVTLCMSIQAIQLYRTTAQARLQRMAQLQEAGMDIDLDKKSERYARSNTQQQQKPNSIAHGERARTSWSGGLLRTANKPSTVAERFREKTYAMEQARRRDDSSILEVAKKVNYKHFSVQIWMMVSRVVAFVWCYAYHDYQSWVLLAWIMHSTFFKSTNQFFNITVTYYLPFFVLTFVFYYVINIPRVIEFQTMQNNFDTWLSLGFYQFKLPPVEVLAMFLCLTPFFFLIKNREYLRIKQDEQKKIFLETLASKDSPSILYFLFVLITNLDLIVFIAIFFSGVNKIDFYHIFLMFFFVAYILAPKWFKKNYIYLLYYVNFFVFEKYLYTLIEHYIPVNSKIQQFLDVFGLSTDYNDKSSGQYFRYPPKIQQWILIIVVFAQYQVHKLLQNEELVEKLSEDVNQNFKQRYPRLYHYWELLQHLKKEFLILLTFMVFFVIIIFSDKNIINWGFQIIICIFIITYVGVNNHHIPHDNGITRLQRVWFLIIWYAAFVLIVQITFQFAALPYIRQTFNLDYILNLLPLWIRKNLRLIGFQVYTELIWQKFMVYLMYFAIGVYVKEQMILWNKIEESTKNIELLPQPNVAVNDLSRNSDMQEDYFQDKTKINWKSEFLKIRFTTPYLVYKLRKLWFIVDKCSQLIFVFISLMIMILATKWQISLSMAIHLTCFIGLCLQIASRLYHNRKMEKRSLRMKSNSETKEKGGQKYRRELTIEECELHWKKYKQNVNNHQVHIRQKVWFFQFVITLLCIALIYPSEFIFYVRKTFEEQRDQPELVALLDYITFYLFWIGVFHCPKQVSGHGYFYNLYGYLIILVLLVFEKNAQHWALNRFGCTPDRVKWFTEIEENLQQKEKKKSQPNIADQIIEEEKEYDDEDNQSENHNKNKSSQNQKKSILEQSQKSVRYEQNEEESKIVEGGEYSGLTEEELRSELKKWISKKYMLKLLNGFKILLEETTQLLLVISSVYKDSVVGCVLMFGVFLFLVRRKIKTISRLAWITGISMIVQYGLALSNLTSDNNPMDFPFPFNPYPPTPQDEGEFFIPWYRKIPLLKDSFPWQVYLSMGVSNDKLDTIWIDYVIMGCIQASLFYFGCQLFSINLRVKKGEYLVEAFNTYANMIAGNCRKETVLKETKKLKRQVFAYNFYKGSQMTVFMHFHQITIVVTLLLAILARSLVSFGYIAVCLVMIYENHKFFNQNKNNFKLQKVLKYWVQPYVFLDIAVQLAFQIPLPFLHDGQDEPSSWQNIIGLQDIWTEDPNEVNEVTAKSISYIVLKAFTFYFVTLQIQIFDSKAYHAYMHKEFTNYLQMAKDKGQALIWKFNNFKLEKIKLQQSERSKMDEMLLNLKKVIKKWQSHTNQDLDSRIQIALDQEPSKRDTMSGGRITNQSSVISKRAPPQDDNRSLSNQNSFISNNGIPDVQLVSAAEIKQSIKSSQFSRAGPGLKKSGTVSFKNPSSSNRNSLQHISEDEEFFENKDNQELLDYVKGKLPFLVKILIWIKKNLTDQIIFISSSSYLAKVRQDMEQGKLNILTKWERRILSDLRDLRKKKKITQPADIDLKQLKRVKDFTRIIKILQAYFRLIFEILGTYSDSVCYILMIVSMMRNAGLISLLYPLLVFGYALMEETNTRKRFWYVVMIYTETLILSKFIYQLSFWDALFNASDLSTFQDKLNGVHVGLVRLASDAFGKMITYFLPEILILLSIMAHIQKEIMTGSVFDIKEQNADQPVNGLPSRQLKQENIEQALLRYLRHNPGDPLLKAYYLEPQLKAEELFNSSAYDFRRATYTDELMLQLADQDDINQVWMKKGKDGRMRERADSLPDQEQLEQIYEMTIKREELEAEDQEIIKGKTIRWKIIYAIQALLYKNSYFEKLFPSVRVQKPGRDLYAVIATFQFLICMFMIFFYTKMDADVTNISDSLTYNQFSGQMVIALFLQILVMIIDRYLYKSKTFIFEEQKKLRNNKTIELAVPAAVNAEDTNHKSDGFKINRLMKQIRDKRRAAGGSRDDNFNSMTFQEEVEQLEEINEGKIIIEKTKITLAMVSKYYLQIFLLLFVHAFVFWYFPITGNLKLQNYPYCVTKTSNSKDKIACNEFGENWALVIFYILYCGYFWVSALQIRFGVAEIKKSNFLMNSYHIVNYVAFKGFMAIPFLFELKTFVDWTFTRTALDVFQWFILSATHAELYIAHSLQGRYQRKPLGKPVPAFLKIIMGFCGQLLIILLIAGPLLLFSTFNPISTPDPVINAQIQFNILIEPEGSQARNTINLFTNNYVTTLKKVTDQQYDIMQFTTDARTKSFDRELIQFIKMNNFPDSSWAVSTPNRDYLKKEFQKAVNNQSTSNLYIQLSYSFDRQNQNIPTAHKSIMYDLSETQYRPILTNFSNAFNLNCQGGQSNATSNIQIKQLFTGVHFLSDFEQAIPSTNEFWMKGLQIFYSCKDYWTVDQLLVTTNDSFPEQNLPSSKNPGIAFFTFSSKTAPSYFRYSVLTFYLSIVLVIGKLIRSVLVIGGNRIFIFEIPRAEPLLQLCECVYIYRMRQKLDKEEQLYFIFVDIMRSPEMIKAITGSAMKKKAQ